MKRPAFFDALLLDIGLDDHLLFEHQGQHKRLPITPGLGALAHAPQGPRPVWCEFIGLLGVVRATAHGAGAPHGLYGFEPYQDQTMRRAYELDSPADSRRGLQRNRPRIGWRNQRHPEGFLAPEGLLPGIDGDFVEDLSEDQTLAVPLEFRRLCERLGLRPETVLQGFMADAAHLHNFRANPRADGLSSHGSDERELASHYLERAYGVPPEEAV